jgi:hypothetical protein
LGALVWYVARQQPDRELYRARGVLTVALGLGQTAALIYLLSATRQIGFGRFFGAPNLIAWLRGDAYVPPEPEAQGPALGPDGRLQIGGAFTTSRNASNFALLPILWLMPRMTANLATVNAILTVHLVAGSFHEEARLEKAYGRAYRDYKRSGVPFFFPSLPPTR